MRTPLFGLLVLCGAASGSFVKADGVFFQEGFDDNAANFFDFFSASIVDHVSLGGADGGGFVSTDFAFNDAAGSMGLVLFRAQDEFGSSGGGFIGNYLAEQVEQVSFSVRHNAPVPLNFNLRFAGPGNFPGAVATSFVPVFPGSEFTEITFDVEPDNPQFVTFEGSSFSATFSNVGHLQFGVSIPDSLAASTTRFTFDLDEIVITTAVPEPSGALLGVTAVGLCVATLRSRSGGVRHG